MTQRPSEGQGLQQDRVYDQEQDDPAEEVHATACSDEDISLVTQQEWIEELRSLFASRDPSQRPDITDDLGHFGLVYNIRTTSPKRDAWLFRMLVSFHTNIKIMSDMVFRNLELDIEPYHGGPIQVLGHQDQTPIGTVKLRWGFCGREKLYNTLFYVVEGVNYDLLLGMPSA
ncbi:hypothetical protein BO78DRAFT_416833 [Aspergillus sclerotiicarbonarius CBS 121057]|uniref:Uncharacterized protein n=1 Tax=Aspergillus sclerotiicarbonarius (strain CBS 121057 / IBT 28362) TaxID=1448318 RepID=A0A319F095_ASPSB|nr:hypothetical protein BO78DRAFT_416833 [Aspergillus sclerotiicarbonarius CBS 121057]